MYSNSDAKSHSDDAGEESVSSSSNTPSEQNNVGLSPLTSLPSDFRAALDAFRHDWQREIDAATNEHDTNNTNIAELQTNKTNDDNHALAMNLFCQAVELEQRGKVYDALPLYRRAVQLEPDIEFQYYKQQELKLASEPSSKDTVSASDANTQDADEIEVNENLLDKFEADIDKNYNGRLILSNRDSSVISTSLHISDLPTELILYILQWVISNQLDVRSLENCAAVCKGLYLCARDEEIWRLACVKVWGSNLGTLEGPRFIPTDDDIELPAITRRFSSWRQMFIDRERVLFHGCYLSKTSYLRMGENSFQDQFYRPIQVVDYYRYLRFLPDGSVLMMTTADEPQVGVTKLKNIYPVRGDVKKGEYVLNDSNITIIFNKSQQHQAQNTRRQKRANQINEEKSSTKYRLELKIASTNKRKFCKLVWVNYSIVIMRNDVESITEFEMTPAKYPSYRFSAVRSYHLDADAPLS